MKYLLLFIVMGITGHAFAQSSTPLDTYKKMLRLRVNTAFLTAAEKTDFIRKHPVTFTKPDKQAKNTKPADSTTYDTLSHKKLTSGIWALNIYGWRPGLSG